MTSVELELWHQLELRGTIMAGTITTEDKTFVETWEHISPQGWGIIRLDPRGEERPEIITGRRNFMITTEERIITEDRIKNEADDPFLNGSFRPVVVPDSVSIESNPNALSDDEIDRILNAESELAWSENLSVIDSVATLRRMIERAEDNEDLTYKRFRQLEERLEIVRGEVRIDTKDPALKNFLSDRPNPDAGVPTAQNGAQNPRRSMGGRSSDYR